MGSWDGNHSGLKHNCNFVSLNYEENGGMTGDSSLQFNLAGGGVNSGTADAGVPGRKPPLAFTKKKKADPPRIPQLPQDSSVAWALAADTVDDLFGDDDMMKIPSRRR